MSRYVVTVVRTLRLSPHMVRVTLGSEDLRGFRDDGPDQRFKLMLPLPGQTAPILPDPDDWYASWQQMPEDVRPVLRTYTVRQARPSEAELDVDFVLHEPAGPACRWAAAAACGDTVGIQGAWAEYEALAGATHQLIVGDHTALPAIAAIGEQLTPDAQADVVVEVPDPADVLPLTVPPGVRVNWVVTHPDGPGRALAEAVEALPPSSHWDYAWVAADKDSVARLRRHLIDARGLVPSQIMFMGYWRTDGAIDG